jgi:hypothetical protein
MRANRCAFLLCTCLVATAVSAADNFSYATGEISPGLPTTRAGFKTLDDLFNGLKSDPNTFFDVDLRGLSAFTFVTTVGNQVGVGIDIPSLGISQVFAAPTRDQAFDLVQDFLLEGDNASRIQRELARVSPFDPVAGNPTSLMARAVARDFDSAFLPFATNIMDGPPKVAQVGATPAGAAPTTFRPMPGIGAHYGNFQEKGLTAQTATLPLSLTMRSALDPRRQFAVALPITLTDVEGAVVYSGALGASLRIPLASPWALTGSFSYNATGSSDLGSAAQMLGASVVSSYLIRARSVDVAIGNMLGYYRTLDTSIAGVKADPGIGNTVLRNGVLVSHPAPEGLGSGLTLEYSLVNTYYAGTDLYLNNYNEVGVALGTNKRADSVRSYVQGRLTYVFSSKTKGANLSFSYWF